MGTLKLNQVTDKRLKIMNTNEFLKIQVLKEINKWVQNKTKKKILQILKKVLQIKSGYKLKIQIYDTKFRHKT